MVKWKQLQWQRVFFHMAALSASCCYAALFYRCVLLNAFKELFAAKYLSLHIFQAFCSLFTLLCQTFVVCSRSLFHSFVHSVFVCVSTITALSSCAVSLFGTHIVASFEQIICFIPFSAHTNPCSVISTILVILLFFVCVIYNLFLFWLFHYPPPLDVSNAIANNVVDTFYVDVNNLNCF